jgi:hypothetical protein
MLADSVQTDNGHVVVEWPAVVLTAAVLVLVALLIVFLVRRVRRNRRPAVSET